MTTLTMQDIANLASVSRQAVSMWRKRPTVRGVSIPFPAPVRVINGVERFDHGEIVGWLKQTGRGNKGSVDAELDAPALSVPDGVALEDVVTLLSWHAMTGRGLVGTTSEDRIEAAGEVDGTDQVLLTEVRELDATPSLLTYADELIDASFGPADALARLEGGRLGRERGARDLNGEGRAIIRAIVGTVVAHQGVDDTAIRATGDPSIALAVSDLGTRLVAADDEPGRAARRRAVLRDVPVGEVKGPGSVTVASLLGLDADAALDLLDEVVLDLPEGEIAVVVGSGAVLADTLRGADRRKRDSTLRVGNLVVALRLPRGQWREAHRQNTAVWVCRGGAEESAVQVGDISNIRVAEYGDLSADIAAALAKTARRAYRFTRLVAADSLVSEESLAPVPVVARGISAPVRRGADRTDHLDRVHQATMETSVPAGVVDVLVAPSRSTFVLNRRSLGEMEDRKELRTYRRTRVDPERAEPKGSIPILPDTGLRMDPIDAERFHPSATRTEPGDIIITEKPRPRAWVDATGGALVASPARILRLGRKAVVGPYLVAGVVNTLVADGSEWRTWQIPIPDRAELLRLERALVDVATYEDGLRARLAAADNLGAALIEGVAAGALTLDVGDVTHDVTVARRDISTPDNRVEGTIA